MTHLFHTQPLALQTRIGTLKRVQIVLSQFDTVDVSIQDGLKHSKIQYNVYWEKDLVEETQVHWTSQDRAFHAAAKAVLCEAAERGEDRFTKDSLKALCESFDNWTMSFEESDYSDEDEEEHDGDEGGDFENFVNDERDEDNESDA